MDSGLPDKLTISSLIDKAADQIYQIDFIL